MLKANASAPEKIAFEVHPAILHTVISAQSGTLHKAILELVMNSCDAGAKKIEVTITNDSFIVTDNGAGFSGEEEVRECFRLFGAPQTTEKTYGRFRIGRGQSFSWGVLTWASGPFRMDVDVQQYNYNFHFSKDQPHVKGCSVTCSLYEQLSPYMLRREVDELIEITKYVKVPVKINGHVHNKNPEKIEWQYETDEAYISLNSDTWSRLDVYNQGVLAISYPFVEFGMGGVVVSKIPLTVNFARNDIILSQCEVWRKIFKFLKKVGGERLLTKRNLTPDEQASIIRRFVAGEFLYQQVRGCPILTDISGVCLSIGQLLKEKQVTVCYNQKSVLADHVQTSKMARVLTGKTLSLFGARNLDAFVGYLGETIELEWSNSDDDSDEEWCLNDDLEAIDGVVWISDIEHYSQFFNGGYIAVPDENLTKTELNILKAVRATQKHILTALMDSEAFSLDGEVYKREIIAGESDSCAWTDGASFIWINRKHLKNCTSGVEHFLFLCQLISHEYLHDSSDCEGHIHDAHFHEAYHRVSLHRATRKKGCDLYIAAKKMARRFTTFAYNSGSDIPKGLLQFDGVTFKKHHALEMTYRSSQVELESLKKQGPFVDDPERLVFYRAQLGGAEIKGVMTLIGPCLDFNGIRIELENIFCWSDLMFFKQKEGDVWKWHCISFDNERYYEDRRPFRNKISQADRLGLLNRYLESASDAEIITFCKETGCVMNHAEESEKNLNRVVFSETRACKVHLRAWIKKEPLLSTLCKENSAYGARWYAAATAKRK